MPAANFSILGFILFPIAIFLLFRLLHFATARFMKSTKLGQSILRILFGLEFLVWIIFVYTTAERSLTTKPILSLIMVLLLVFIAVWFFWFVLRDYLAGLHIRATGRLKLNQSIIIDDIKAKVTGFKNNCLVLDTENSAILEIPYSKLLAKNIEYLSQSAEEEFIINFELKTEMDNEAIKQKIASALFETPWVNHQVEPEISLQNTNGKNYIMLKIMLLDKKYRSRLEMVLRNMLKKSYL